MHKIKETIQESIRLKEAVWRDEALLSVVEESINVIVNSLQNGGKILFCGNGGSAADAQHLAAELSGRFYKDREPLFAEALHVNSSYMTAVANDYGFDEVYSRMMKAKGRSGDVLVALSTSGNSRNIVKAAKEARKLGMKILSLTGESGGALKPYSDLLMALPSTDTPRIQEAHILIGHIICQQVENRLFPNA
ncbi:MAG: D-sedoheptulose-7-phosphate isomerase [Bacteroidota bacterium]